MMFINDTNQNNFLLNQNILSMMATSVSLGQELIMTLLGRGGERADNLTLLKRKGSTILALDQSTCLSNVMRVWPYAVFAVCY